MTQYVKLGARAIVDGLVRAELFPQVVPIDTPLSLNMEAMGPSYAHWYRLRTWPLESAPDVSMAEPEAQMFPAWRWLTAELEFNADRIGAAPLLLYIGQPSMPAGLVRYIRPVWAPGNYSEPTGTEVWSLVFETQ